VWCDEEQLGLSLSYATANSSDDSYKQAVLQQPSSVVMETGRLFVSFAHVGEAVAGWVQATEMGGVARLKKEPPFAESEG
jgi:hypothetical protein